MSFLQEELFIFIKPYCKNQPSQSSYGFKWLYLEILNESFRWEEEGGFIKFLLWGDAGAFSSEPTKSHGPLLGTQ